MSARRARTGPAGLGDDQRQRIERTLSFIDEHLGEGLDLEALARIACFSKFHFHRVFKLAQGMSPQQYLTRRRLERAYHFLVNAPELPVGELAGLLGFSSSSNFARAFREQFGFRPRDLRTSVADPFRDSWSGEGTPFTIVDPAGVQLEPVAPFKVLFARVKGTPTPGVAEPVLAALRAECAARGWREEGARELVVARSVPVVTGAEAATFDLGIELPPEVDFDDAARVQRLGGANYARYEHRGHPALLSRCWEELYGLWLRRSGTSVGTGFAFTVTPSGGFSTAADPRFQLYLPLRSRVGG